MHGATRLLLRTIVSAVAAALVAACAPDTTARIGGATHWIDAGEGELKAQVFAGAELVDRPILILILHGDLPDPPPDYQYLFAKLLTLPDDALAWSSLGGALGPDWTDERVAATAAAIRAALGATWSPESIVAAGVLRPGYADSSGDRSSGEMGLAVGDNYTPDVVDAVATVARSLAGSHNARAVVLVGHSGGATIVANIMGRHPDVAEAALLVGCGCDPEGWRARMHARGPSPIWEGPTGSLLPLSLVDGVATAARVRLVVGEADDVTLPEDSRKYAEALQARGIDARLAVAPGLGHNILMSPDAFRELSALVSQINQ
jgi:pimeloyl-ACP methyl ester carboxylesterase